MKKNGHRLLTLAALVGTAAGVIHIANRFIDATSQLKDMLEQPHSKTYDWRFGKIFYTKQGHGTPVLLIHDIMPGASGYEWNAVEKQLATEHTVYTLDLLGCGRSEKPDSSYTSFVFSQLLCDFAKNVICEETDVIVNIEAHINDYGTAIAQIQEQIEHIGDTQLVWNVTKGEYTYSKTSLRDLYR